MGWPNMYGALQGKSAIVATSVFVFILIGALLFLSREPILLAVGDYLVIQDQLQPADVIHVIAGDDDRTDYAIQLYKKGYAKQIFFTGGWCTIHNYDHGEHGKELAMDQGVPAQALADDDSWVTSTYSEALRLKEWVYNSQTPIHSVIVVSDPFHMRRVRWTYKQLFGDKISLQMAPVPFGLSPYSRYWWTDDKSRKLVKDEYLKIVYYVARYQLGWGPLKNWLASFDKY